jgi:hypothetical protein
MLPVLLERRSRFVVERFEAGGFGSGWMDEPDAFDFCFFQFVETAKVKSTNENE